MLQKYNVPLCLLVILSFLATGLTGDSGGNTKAAESQSLSSESLVQTAQAFRKLFKSKKYEQARTMMTHNPRRWFRKRQGPGRPWKIGPGAKGPWADWDEHFRSLSEVVKWLGGKNSATLVNRETNDYFRLLEQGWATVEIIYLFDNAGKIEGLLIRSGGDRLPGRSDEFLKWAKEHNPKEIEYLMPGGDIDPSGDRPKRFRALLNQWRKSAGLPVIEID
ncbi:MAG: hypothetical protein GY940_11105 [bacterium]|nr:hypothetical protein [bacterium]